MWFVSKGWVTFSADFRGKGATPTNRCWCQSNRVIALSCGIKISAVHSLDLSQSTRVTDGQTDGWTDRQNYDSQDRRRICSRGDKTETIVENNTKKLSSLHSLNTFWWWRETKLTGMWSVKDHFFGLTKVKYHAILISPLLNLNMSKLNSSCNLISVFSGTGCRYFILIHIFLHCVSKKFPPSNSQ